jgi:hypothetical protein
VPPGVVRWNDAGDNNAFRLVDVAPGGDRSVPAGLGYTVVVIMSSPGHVQLAIEKAKRKRGRLSAAKPLRGFDPSRMRRAVIIGERAISSE